MKLRIVFVDFEMPARVKRWALRIGIPAAFLLGGGAIAYASGLVTWSDGQTLKAADLNDSFAAVQTPPGTVVAFAGPAVPSGWLLCDGSPVSRTTYAGLFSAIGTTAGSGDGATTFDLPDYRGYFLRGLDTSGSRDPDVASRTALNSGGNTAAKVGSVEGDAFAAHTHTVGAAISSTGLGETPNQGSGEITGNSNNTITSSSAGGSAETRPKNVAVNYLIKY